MWTLIIVAVMVAGQSSGGHAVSVENIPYMHTQEACMKAGTKLIEHMRARQHYVDIYAICVKDR